MSNWRGTFCRAIRGGSEAAGDRVHELRGSVYDEDEAAGARGAGDVRVLRGDGLLLETGDPAYWKTLEVLWKDLSQAQMYVTGGVGARSEGEAFGNDFELPNAQAYGESCAAIGNMMWNWRMLRRRARRGSPM